MIFGKYINRYYLRHAPVLLLGILALLMVDYIQLLVPQLYRLVINGVNLGQVVVRGETMPFTKEVLFQHICLPMIWIVLLMVVGRFLWRICFFGTSIRVQADLREKMFDHSRRLSQQYYQVNKVGNLMSLYTNDLDTIQECFGDGILMFFDALVLGLLALYRMWCMDRRMTMLALIPAAFMFAIGTVMGKLGMDYTVNNLATSADLGDAKTLIVVAGGSSKGLGAAGIDADGELARLTELLDGAKEKGLSIIVMHTGGEARRGDLSDKFIAPCFEKADYAIVVAAGDSDGLMSGLCAENGIPMDSINSISDVTTVLPAAFK